MTRAAVLFLVVACVTVGTAHADASIYRCVSNGVTTFSDRPCGGGDSTEYSPPLERVSTYEAPPMPKEAAIRAAKAPKRRAGGASIAAAQRKHAEECRRIEASLRDIRSQQRAGYGVKEGERLKERQRALNERRRAKRCG